MDNQNNRIPLLPYAVNLRRERQGEGGREGEGEGGRDREGETGRGREGGRKGWMQ